MKASSKFFSLLPQTVTMKQKMIHVLDCLCAYPGRRGCLMNTVQILLRECNSQDATDGVGCQRHAVEWMCLELVGWGTSNNPQPPSPLPPIASKPLSCGNCQTCMVQPCSKQCRRNDWKMIVALLCLYMACFYFPGTSTEQRFRGIFVDRFNISP